MKLNTHDAEVCTELRNSICAPLQLLKGDVAILVCVHVNTDVGDSFPSELSLVFLLSSHVQDICFSCLGRCIHNDSCDQIQHAKYHREDNTNKENGCPRVFHDERPR